MATIKDVARQARVSISTVSHALSGNRPVSEPTRRRVLEAVESLGYHPNWTARSLVSHRTRVVGLVVADISNPFYPIAARGVEDQAHRRDHNLIICSTDGDEQRESESIDLLAAGLVDGLVYMAGRALSPQPELLVGDEHMPVVVADEDLGRPELPTVCLDNRAAGRLAAEHLLSLGHRRVAYIGGPEDLRTVSERLAGFHERLLAEGIGLDDGLIEFADNRPEGGAGASDRLLARSAPPSAIFVANDVMALGVLESCRLRGVRVPQDLSVVGVDDLPIARWAGLTTVRQPIYEIGATAAELLFGILDGDDHGARRVVFEPELVIRSTTAVRDAPVLT